MWPFGCGALLSERSLNVHYRMDSSIEGERSNDLDEGGDGGKLVFVWPAIPQSANDAISALGNFSALSRQIPLFNQISTP